MENILLPYQLKPSLSVPLLMLFHFFFSFFLFYFFVGEKYIVPWESFVIFVGGLGAMYAFMTLLLRGIVEIFCDVKVKSRLKDADKNKAVTLDMSIS